MIELACKAFGSSPVVALTSREAMNELPRWRLEVTHDAVDIDLAAAAGEPATLTLRDEIEGVTRTLDLMIVSAGYLGPARAGHRYELELSAPLWRFTLRRGYRIHLEKAAHETVVAVLKDGGVPEAQIALRIAGDTFQRDQVTQYDETDFGYVERLLAEEGFSYWFDDRDGKSVFVVGDNQRSHEPITGQQTLTFRDKLGGDLGSRGVSDLELDRELTSTGTFLRDFDVRQPDVYIDGRAGDDKLVHFEYPAFVPNGDEAATRAAIRLEQLQRHAARARAITDCMRMQPGRLMRIDGASDDDFNVEYIITAVEHELTEGTSGGREATVYRNRVTLAPSAKRPFRPALPQPRPRLDGIDSAFTTGPKGEEIHVDDLGRVKLRFPWDPSGISDDRSSTWARGLQWALSGSMFLPRVGWEVAVMYLDGSPDRPFVMQRLYNGTAPVPYGLPAAGATTAIKTVSSPGGAAVSELRLGDDAGKQEFYMHAGRDQQVKVGGDSVLEVGLEFLHDVTLVLATVIEGTHELAVRAWRSVDVGSDYATTIDQSHVNTVEGLEKQSVGANRVVKTKTYFEGVAGAYALECNQSNLITKGSYINMNVGTCRLNAGLATAENVMGARLERITGDHTIETRRTFTDNPWGRKRITAGAGVEIAKEDLTCIAPRGKISSQNATVKAESILIEGGKDVIVKASSLLTKAVEISGGVIKSKKVTVIDAGQIIYKQGGEYE
jgi:type VI secretion system secreted protein VgrG